MLKRVILSCILGFVSLSTSAVASDEAALRAAFVYKFIKFIEWPHTANQPSVHLCAVGAVGDSRTALAPLNGKPVATQLVDGKPIVKQVIELIYLDDAAAIAQTLKSCQMLYRPADATPLALPNPLPNGVIMVVDGPVETETNTSITLERSQDGRIEFSIYLAAANRAGVSISSQLLKLAKNSRGGKE